MYTVLNVVLGYAITVTFICNESQVEKVLDFIRVCEGSAVDIIEQVEANFDCRAVSPATYDPFNWNSEVVFGPELVDDMSTVLSLKDMAEHLMKILVDNMIDDAEVLAEAIWDLFIPVPFPSLEEIDEPRTCSHCGNVMYEGYCIDNGLEYYCSDECLHEHYTEEEYLEMYDDGNGDSYWTEWEDEENEERADLIYEYEIKIAKAKRNNDTEAQYYYQDKLDELLREDDLTGSLTNKKEE